MKIKFIFLALSFSLPAFADPQHLTILHFNDFHGHVDMASRIAAKVKKIEGENFDKGWHTIVLNGGDLISGTPISAKFKGEAEVKFINEIGTDAIVLGNHDFDFGIEALLKNIADTEFPTLAANVFKGGEVYPAQAGVLIFKESINKEHLNVAIFGLAHEKTPTLTSPANVKMLRFGKAVPAAKKAMATLEKYSDVQIALTHEGVKNDIKLAGSVDGIDVIVGGHDHVRIDDYCRMIKKVPVCQTPPHGAFLGRIDITIDGNNVTSSSYELIPIEKSDKEDAATKKILKPYIDSSAKEMGEVIGIATRDILHDRTSSAASPLGALIATVMKDGMAADFGMINTGGIRRGLKKGKIALGDIEEIVPFPNTVLKIGLTGKEISALFKEAKKLGKLLQLSGLTTDTKLDPKKEYTVATIDFLTNGGDGYTLFKKGRVIESSRKYIKEILTDYIRRTKKL